MIDPTGATMVHKALEDAWVCQKAASDCLGGTVVMKAGVLTDTVVSETSRLGELAKPAQSTEHVAEDPWEGGGVQMEIRLIFTEPKRLCTVVFTTVQTVPAAQRTLMGEIAVIEPDVEVKR